MPTCGAYLAAALTCLRQLAQQQAATIMAQGETLEEQLFTAMDQETDERARRDFGCGRRYETAQAPLSCLPHLATGPRAVRHAPPAAT